MIGHADIRIKKIRSNYYELIYHEGDSDKARIMGTLRRYDEGWFFDPEEGRYRYCKTCLERILKIMEQLPKARKRKLQRKVK